MAKLPVPDFLVAALLFSGVVVILSAGVQYQIGRKTRTSLAEVTYIEDSKAGNNTRFRVLAGREDTGGEYAVLEVLIRPAALGAVRGKPGSLPEHLHLQQREYVLVKQGQLGYWVGDSSATSTAGPGDVVRIPPGAPHTLWNAGGNSSADDTGGSSSTGGSAAAELVFEVVWAPAGSGELPYETLAGLGQDYESVLAISPLQQLLTFHRAGLALASYSPASWDVVGSYLVPFAEALGYKAFYPAYRSAPRDPDSLAAARTAWQAVTQQGEGEEA